MTDDWLFIQLLCPCPETASGGIDVIARNWLRRILLAFVLITIGFSLGRHTPPTAGDLSREANRAETGRDHLVVYAAHMTFRCFECTQIEFLARDLLETEFPDYLADGRIRMVAVDYMKDEPFAAMYDIASSTLVLSLIQEGKESHFKRLDEVWSHVRNREAYMEFVRNAIWELIHLLEGHEG